MLPEKKEGNIFEFSITGIFELNSRTDLKLISEEICENNFISFNYEISSFVLESFQGFQNVSNLIEYNHNLVDNYRLNEYKIDNDVFYNGVSYMEKLDEYYTISKFFIKYITNSYLYFPLGSCSIIEMARCEDNMDLILSSIGYTEKSKIKKRGEFIKFKNLPIIILLSLIENINIDQSNDTILSDKSASASNQKRKEHQPVINNFIEIIGFCYEAEKDIMMNRLKIIQEKLSPLCTFESEIKNQ